MDRDKLRAHLRKLPGENLLELLDRAVDLLPTRRLAKFADGFVRLEDFRPDPAGPAGGKRLIDAVKAFHEASLRGEYYEAFNVNSKNFMQESRGTQVWIAECNRLLDLCIATARKGGHAEAREGFRTIFDLLRHIDEGHDDVIFFADEGGSWQVGVDWEKVLPAYFTCLSAVAEPEEYSQAVSRVVDDFVRHDRDKHLRKARIIANAAQRKVLR